MDRIISIRSTPFYLPSQAEKVSNEENSQDTNMVKHLELSVITEGSKYEANEKGEVVRLPNFKEFSFVIQAEHLNEMLENLKKINEG